MDVLVLNSSGPKKWALEWREVLNILKNSYGPSSNILRFYMDRFSTHLSPLVTIFIYKSPFPWKHWFTCVPTDWMFCFLLETRGQSCKKNVETSQYVFYCMCDVWDASLENLQITIPVITLSHLSSCVKLNIGCYL